MQGIQFREQQTESWAQAGAPQGQDEGALWLVGPQPVPTHFKNGIAWSECVCAYIILIDTAAVPSVESVSPLHISPALCKDACFFPHCQYEWD